jgi:hypothetical protein
MNACNAETLRSTEFEASTFFVIYPLVASACIDENRGDEQVDAASHDFLGIDIGLTPF